MGNIPLERHPASPTRARLRDVAEAAGVSIRTVSNVVRDAVPVQPDTRARVEKAIQDLGYVPNLTARRLKSGRSNLIGMLVPEFDVPYFAELARTMSDLASEEGLSLLVQQADGHEETEQHFLARFTSLGLFDGLIVNPLAASAEVIESAARRMPLVAIGEHAVSGSVVRVAIDNTAAAREATEHLLAIGRKRLAAVGVQSGKGADTAQCRLSGFNQAVLHAGLTIQPQHLVETHRYHREHGARAAEHLLNAAEIPDGIFCFNDQLAIGLMHVLMGEGIRIPEDISIVGFDNSEEGRFTNPSLTTVAPNTLAIAKRTLKILTSQIAGRPVVAPDAVPHKLIVRRSSVPQQQLRHTGIGS